MNKPTPLRIGFATAEYPGWTPYGGIGVYVQTMAAGMAQLGHQTFVLLCSPERSAREETSDVPVVIVAPRGTIRLPFPIGRGPGMMVSRCLAATARELHLDILEAPEFGGLTAFVPAKDSRPFKVVVRLHMCYSLVRSLNNSRPTSLKEVATNFLIDRIERRAIIHADAMTSISTSTTVETLRVHGLSRDDIVTIPNPVSPAFFDVPLHTTARIRPDPTVLFVGRLEWRKGPDILVRAFPEVLKRFPKARLRLVGSDTPTAPGDNSMLNHLRSLVTGEVLSHIEFLGARPAGELPQIYGEADVCIFPSRWEGFGIVCAEAMASGRPVIVPRNSGFAEHITDHGNGLLSEGAESGDLAKSIIELLSNTELRHRVGSAARHFALANFSPKSVAELASQIHYRSLMPDLDPKQNLVKR